MKKCPFCKSSNIKKISDSLSEKEFDDYIGSYLYRDRIIPTSEKIYYCFDSDRFFTSFHNENNQLLYCSELLKINDSLIEVFKHTEHLCSINRIRFDLPEEDWLYDKSFLNINENIIHNLVKNMNGHMPLIKIETLVNFT